MSRFLLYALSDPRSGAVRYIGKSTSGAGIRTIARSLGVSRQLVRGRVAGTEGGA